MSADPITPILAPAYEEMLTVRETAGRLTISVASTYQLVRSGRRPHYRIGGAIRVTVSDITRFLADCRHAQPEQRLVVPEPPYRKPLRHLNLSR